VQTGGGTPPLITGFRAYVARNTRFFTSHSSEEIDRFFDYYKEYETRLAVLLSEYYTYRGDPTLTVGENLASAERDVKQIKNVSLPAQRALMPQAELAPLVFIDCGPDNCEKAKDNALMWRTEPTYRSSKDITADGNFSKCTIYAAGDNPNCRLDTKKRFNGYAEDWRPPLMSEAKQLFANHTGDTIPWMNKAGVGFKPAIRFPGYDPSALTYPVSLWVRDGWRIDVPGGRLLDQYTITTQQLTLEARGGGALKDPAEIHSWIANHFSCRVGNTHRELPSVPSCSEPNRSTGGFILWQRPTTKAERNKYW